MATLEDVRERTQSLVGDPDGDWATAEYLDPLINQVYGVMLAYLANSCSTLQEKVIFLPGGAGANQIPQGATDLSAFQKKGGLLSGLTNPLYVEWKMAGQPPEHFAEIHRTSRLPNISPVGLGNGNYLGRMSYEWRGNKLYITPHSQLIDMQVRGDFRASKLIGPDDELLDERMLEPMAFGASGLTGSERGNQNYVLTYGSEAMNVLDDVAASLIRQEQSVSTRIGRTNGRRMLHGSGGRT